MITHVRFAKMEGIGNDFVVVSGESLDGIDVAAAAQCLCRRHTGVGSDGLLVVGPAAEAGCTFSFRMYNPDGSPDICGNGLRCAVLFAQLTGSLGSAKHGEIRVETLAGQVAAEITGLGDHDKSAIVRVEMPCPKFAPRDVPFADTEADKIIDYPLWVADTPAIVTALNTGSTHAVIFCSELPGDAEFETLGPLIERHPYFPERTSAIWACPSGEREYMVRIWERAVAETLGCGTGACAVAAAATIKGLNAFGDEIEVTSKGGSLHVRWPSLPQPIQMTGPARWVYEGEIVLDAPGA